MELAVFVELDVTVEVFVLVLVDVFVLVFVLVLSSAIAGEANISIRNRHNNVYLLRIG